MLTDRPNVGLSVFESTRLSKIDKCTIVWIAIESEMSQSL